MHIKQIWTVAQKEVEVHLITCVRDVYTDIKIWTSILATWLEFDNKQEILLHVLKVNGSIMEGMYM